jgi:c(7)-type cytochrome triheme protein
MAASRCFGAWLIALAAALCGTQVLASGEPAQRVGAAASPAHAVALRLPADIVYEQPADSDRAVIFRHSTHVAMAGNRCLGCHPEPFRMLRPVRHASHVEMDRGGSCGICHDSRTAFGVRDSAACQTCHAGRPAPDLAGGKKADSAAEGPRGSLPKRIRFTRGEASPGPVSFRHDRHPMEGGCVSCHPKPFAMKASGGRPGGAMHEAAACGGCHDGRRAFGVEDASACARCHAGGGGS